MCGRPLKSTATEDQLVADAAFNFALAGRNRDLAQQLGQRLRPPTLQIESLPDMGLPNPALALCSSKADQLRNNLQLVHRRFSLQPGQQERRLICSIDHTYLQRHLCQSKIAGSAGLLGPAWQPFGDEDRYFLKFETMDKDSAKIPAAPLMLECIVWNPCEQKNRPFSVASMPMALKAWVEDKEVRPRNHGKWVAGPAH